MKSRPIVLVMLLLAACATVRREPGMAAFYQACVDATTDAVVLNLAAHPDDEAARTLVYLRRKYGLRTYTLYSTCGGGGQNAIATEIGEDLARVRTRETLAAARITGTQVRWMGFVDFGYSKTAEETFRTWGRQDYLDALDKALDEIRPDVVFTNHGPNRGHGHHRVTSIAARELVAKRPGLFLYERMARQIWFETPDGKRVRKRTKPDVEFPVGEVDASTGESYSRQAMLGWRMHRTQGMGAIGAWRMRADAWKKILPADDNNNRGNNNRGFDPSALPSLFDSKEFLAYAQDLGIDPQALEVELSLFANNRSIMVQVERAKHLLPLLQELRNGWQVFDSPPATWNPVGRRAIAVRLERRIDALERVILEGLGIKVAVSLDQEMIPVGGQAALTLRVWSPNVALDDVRLQSPGGVATNATATKTGAAIKPAPQVWKATVATPPLVSINPTDVWPATLQPTVSLRIGELGIHRHPEIYFTPVPFARLTWAPATLMLPAPQQTVRRTVELEVEWNGQGELESRLTFEASDGVSVQAWPAVVRLSAQQRTAKVKVIITLDGTSRGKLQVVAKLEPNANSANGGINSGTLAASAARLDISAVAARWPRELRIGLIRGPDDTLHQALEDLRLDYQLLDPVTLKAVDLARLTTVVIDIRAYRTRRDLAEQRERILAFCKNGGRVVCFYHKPREWNKQENRPLIAPYDLRIGRRRVSQEDAPVKLLNPGHSIWNYPNKITLADFDGWVQERGLNFPQKWGQEWVAMLEMADKGEKPLRGGLLYAEHGKGQYIYCSLVLYRQLRQGHAGAARILVNLLSR